MASQPSWNLANHVQSATVDSSRSLAQPVYHPPAPVASNFIPPPPLNSSQSPAYFAPQNTNNYLANPAYGSTEEVPYRHSFQHVKAVGGWNDPPPLANLNRGPSSAAPVMDPIMTPFPQQSGFEGPPIPHLPNANGGFGGMAPWNGHRLQPGQTTLGQPLQPGNLNVCDQFQISFFGSNLLYCSTTNLCRSLLPLYHLCRSHPRKNHPSRRSILLFRSLFPVYWILRDKWQLRFQTG